MGWRPAAALGELPEHHQPRRAQHPWLWLGVGYVRGRLPHHLSHDGVAYTHVLPTGAAAADDRAASAPLVHLPSPDWCRPVQAWRTVIGLLGRAHLHDHTLLHAAHAKPSRLGLPSLPTHLSSFRGCSHLCRAARAALLCPYALPLASAPCLRRGAWAAARDRGHREL